MKEGFLWGIFLVVEGSYFGSGFSWGCFLGLKGKERGRLRLKGVLVGFLGFGVCWYGGFVVGPCSGLVGCFK